MWRVSSPPAVGTGRRGRAGELGAASEGKAWRARAGRSRGTIVPRTLGDPAADARGGHVAQADPARTRTRTATAGKAGNGTAPAAKPAARRRSADRSGGPRPEPTLRILETRVLRGPNYWAREPVIRQVVDLGVLEEFPSNKIPGFVDALVGMLPTLEDHACSLGRRGGFITRLREGTWV